VVKGEGVTDISDIVTRDDGNQEEGVRPLKIGDRTPLFIEKL